MYRILLTICISALSLATLNAQLWFDLGLKGAFGPTSALNKNISDEGGYTYNVTAGTAFGGKVGINFGANHGIALEALAAKHKAGYDYKLNGIDMTNDITWKTTDLMMLYRYQGQGAYFEIGPKYSIMQDYSQIDGSAEVQDFNEDHFENYFSGVVGFGSYLAGSKSIQVILGIRVHYAFQDMISEEGFKDLNLPTPNYDPFPNQEKTSPLAAQLSLEINYVLGYVGKSYCYDKWRLMSFD